MPPSVIFASPHFRPLQFSHFVCLTSAHFTSPPVLFASLQFTLCHFASPPLPFPASLHTTSCRLLFFFTRFTSCRLHFMPPPVIFTLLNVFSPYFTPLHFTSHFVCHTSRHFTPLHFASHSFFLTSCHFTLLHFTSLLFASPHLISYVSPLCFAGNASPKKYGFFRKHPIQQTRRPARQQALRKIRIGESFEYLSHLQKIQTFKRFNSNFFPNLSNVLNILQTSLFLQKIQIFERFNSGESLNNFSLLQKIQTFERFALANLLNMCDICKRFGHKIRLKFFPESFECFEYPANFTIFAKDSVTARYL